MMPRRVEASEGGGPNPEKVEPRRVEPRRVEPRRVGGPKGGARNLALFFPSPATIFFLLSLWGPAYLKMSGFTPY